MLVQVAGSYHDSSVEPIILILTEDEKRLIASMTNENKMYVFKDSREIKLD